MRFRSDTCPDCLQVTSGDCGKHNMVYVRNRAQTPLLWTWGDEEPIERHEAITALHTLWSETDYPLGKRDEHKRLWQMLQQFVERVGGK